MHDWLQSDRLVTLLLVENAQSLKAAIAHLDPLPHQPSFKAARDVHRRLKYARGGFALKDVRLVPSQI